MKFAKILMTLGIALALFSCERELPYPIDDTEHGVMIDITMTPGTSTYLSAGVTTDNLSVTLNIPWQQGDYSMLKEAEVMCVYFPASGTTKTATVQTGITSFPAVFNVDMPALCLSLGISAPDPGDRMTFVYNVVLTNGKTILGWNPATGMFNNTAFSPLGVSYRVQYTAFAPFYPELYQGKVEAYEDGDPLHEYWDVIVTPLPADDLPANMPPGATADDLYGMLVENLWDEECSLKIWVNTQNAPVVELIIPTQVVNEAWYYPYNPPGYYTLEFRPDPSSFDIDTLNNIISFTTTVYMPGLGGWSGVEYEIHF